MISRPARYLSVGPAMAIDMVGIPYGRPKLDSARPQARSPAGAIRRTQSNDTRACPASTSAATWHTAQGLALVLSVCLSA